MFEWDSSWCKYFAGFCKEPPRDLMDLGWFSEQYFTRSLNYPDSDGHPVSFNGIVPWYEHVQSLRLRPGQIPPIQLDSFDDALRALFMTYFASGFSKMAEHKALSTLEEALKVAYEKKIRFRRNAGLGAILKTLAEQDPFYAGLADNTKETDQQKRRANAVNVIRDKLSHGESEEVMHWANLFESVKAIMEHAFAHHPQYVVGNNRLATIGILPYGV